MPTAILTDVDPRTVLATLREDAERRQRASIDARFGDLAKAVIELNDQTRAETDRRLDRIESLMETGFRELNAGLGEVRSGLGEVRSGLGEVRSGLAGLTTRVNVLSDEVRKVGARVEEHAGWIAKDEVKGKPQG
jgi:X-X-X-Leu-X-X-Gly heptad repeat protein